ncbi:MAG: hypothetical protein GX294_03550 [Candidatus Cloacimonetes bacterium]|nr:hypothetical protein [Candidatus Cloacimonadota bacterium]
MDDMQERMRERWEERRKKGQNWPRLVIMLIILIALIVAMNMLSKKTAQVKSIQGTEYIDSTAVELEPDAPQTTTPEGESLP